MKAKAGQISKMILDALKAYGPMTQAEICVAIGMSKVRISNIVSRLHYNAPKAGKQIHIIKYVYDAEGMRRYPRAVYAHGFGLDAIKPRAQPKENKRRYEEKRRRMFSMNSVFNMAKTRDQVRAELKGISL